MASQFRAQFEDFFKQISSTVIHDVGSLSGLPHLPGEVIDHLEKSLEMNSHGGKYARAMMIVNIATTILADPLPETTLHELFVLGWIVEINAGSILVIDDIMDSSSMRRGLPCWYRRPEIGLAATNDACTMDSVSFMLLKKYFRNHPAYIDMVELLHQSNFIVQLGQTCDMTASLPGRDGLESFNEERYNTLITYKTGYLGYILPAMFALYYLGLASPENTQQLERILIPVGNYAQAQDDFLDVFGDTKVMGKIGTDIQENKCSWMIVEALKHCNEHQRRELENCYGKRNLECECKVKQVFNDIGLYAQFEEYEQHVVANSREMISQLDEKGGLKKEIFEKILCMILKRKKLDV